MAPAWHCEAREYCLHVIQFVTITVDEAVMTLSLAKHSMLNHYKPRGAGLPMYRPRCMSGYEL